MKPSNKRRAGENWQILEQLPRQDIVARVNFLLRLLPRVLLPTTRPLQMVPYCSRSTSCCCRGNFINQPTKGRRSDTNHLQDWSTNGFCAASASEQLCAMLPNLEDDLFIEKDLWCWPWPLVLGPLYACNAAALWCLFVDSAFEVFDGFVRGRRMYLSEHFRNIVTQPSILFLLITPTQ